MGRGRAKAKQTKVARQLKYKTYEPDLDALQRELAAQEDDASEGSGAEFDDEYGPQDPYADHGDEDSDDSSVGHRYRG